MKLFKKISIFVILSLVICMALGTVAFATETASEVVTEAETTAGGKLNMDWTPSTMGERVEVALQGTVTGMVMIFSVLSLLAVIMTISKVVFHDMPAKKKEEERKAAAPAEAVAPAPAPAPVAETPVVAAAEADDGELVAVITAAIAAMIESGDYKNEFVGGFRVVSFKRSANGAWNRK